MEKLTALAAALALTAALAGCGSAGGGSDAAPGETAATESFSMDNAALATADGGGAATLTPQATGESARKIIYNADLSLESTDFDAARTALTDAVEAHGGYISYSDLSGSAEDQDRYSHYTVRIPADSYRAFLEAVSGAANVLSVSESAEDITSEYIDVEARIASLENQRSRLNELADTAETTADLLEIESQLSDVQYQLESYTRQRQLDGRPGAVFDRGHPAQRGQDADARDAGRFCRRSGPGFPGRLGSVQPVHQGPCAGADLCVARGADRGDRRDRGRCAPTPPARHGAQRAWRSAPRPAAAQARRPRREGRPAAPGAGRYAQTQILSLTSCPFPAREGAFSSDFCCFCV